MLISFSWKRKYHLTSGVIIQIPFMFQLCILFICALVYLKYTKLTNAGGWHWAGEFAGRICRALSARVTLPTILRLCALISKAFGLVLFSCLALSGHMVAGAVSSLLMGICELHFCGISPESCSRYRGKPTTCSSLPTLQRWLVSHANSALWAFRYCDKTLEAMNYKEKAILAHRFRGCSPWSSDIFHVQSLTWLTHHHGSTHGANGLQWESRRNRRKRDQKLQFPISFGGNVSSLQWPNSLLRGLIS